jgi:hypothetical protein
VKPIDYTRAFLITTPPGDEVRFAIESRTRIIDDETGVSEDFWQAASCKSERSFVKEDIFIEDNYDFLPVFGPDHVVVFRRKAWLNPNYRTVQESAGFFGDVKCHLPEPHACDELIEDDAIFRATQDFRPLVAQTEIWNDALKLRAIIEYPIKTMNTVRPEHYDRLAKQVDNPMDVTGRNSLYQTDTGPVAFPDLSSRYACHAECLWLAFVAFNAPDAAEFIIEEPVPILEGGHEGKELCKTRHHMRRVRLTAKNRFYAIG